MVVVVVVDVDWQTEMFTAVPLATWVPAAGDWVSTLPDVAPLGHVVSVVWLATSPAPVMADCAALADWPTTLGTEMQGPLETTRLTGVLGGTVAPPAGLCDDTSPCCGNWFEHALLWLPTFSPAWVRVEPADAGDCPSTLGTETEVCVPDTVSTTGTVAFTLAPPAGFWSRTVPTGWVLVTLLTL